MPLRVSRGLLHHLKGVSSQTFAYTTNPVFSRTAVRHQFLNTGTLNKWIGALSGTQTLHLHSDAALGQPCAVHVMSQGWRGGAPTRHLTSSASKEAATRAKVRGIQKDVSPLTTKRIVRRKKTKDSVARDQEVFDVMAYATAEEYSLESLRDDLIRQGLYGIIKLPDDAPDALHVEALYRVGDDPREIFFFREGSVVFWNMPEVEREAVLKFLRRHQEGSYDHMLCKEEYEHVEFCYTEQVTQLQGDEIQLQRHIDGEPPVNRELEQYAFSNAIALSVKLSIWEASLDRYVDSIEFVLQDLKLGRKLKMSQEEILRKTGELLTLRHLINLSTDLLDTPDFYWDRERLEALYNKTCNYLHISRRTKVMNEKLTHCYELSELLRDQLKDAHHVRLEWMIILLIMVEVFFEIMHVVERKFGGAKEEHDS